jgi:diadenosine tetraphosphatase ApaH/serine/threonine PP2A family protein phosphatase
VSELDVTHGVQLRRDRDYFVNPGSVDASRKRTAKLAEFAIFDSDKLTVRFDSLPYDDAATEQKAEKAGYRIDRWRDRLYDVQRRIVGPRHIENSTP